eukprot:6214095-Pleurochrysis_carterae.AAC.4
MPFMRTQHACPMRILSLFVACGREHVAFARLSCTNAFSVRTARVRIRSFAHHFTCAATNRPAHESVFTRSRLRTSPPAHEAACA